MIPMVPLNSNRFHGIPWNWHQQLHGIPWNMECANFDETSMECHGTSSAPISLTRAAPWNSVELRLRQFRWHQQFHGIPWHFMELGVSQFRWYGQYHGIPWNSVEFHVRQFRWLEQYNEIPWNPLNLKCANFADTSSSTEFHGTWSAPISLTQEGPWNSVELVVRQFRWNEQ